MDLKEPLTPFKMATVIGIMVAIIAAMLEYSRHQKFSFFIIMINGTIGWVTVYLFYKLWLYVNDYIETM